MLEDLLREVAERNWQVNNLFQHKSGYWQCNLRQAEGQWATVWGQGRTAAQALVTAMEMAESMTNWVEIPEYIPARAVEEAALDLQKVLGKLLPTIQRRF